MNYTHKNFSKIMTNLNHTIKSMRPNSKFNNLSTNINEEEGHHNV